MLYLGILLGCISLVLFTLIFYAHFKNKELGLFDSINSQATDEDESFSGITAKDLVNSNLNDSQQFALLYLLPHMKGYFDGGNLYQILLSLDFNFGEINVFHKYALDFNNKQVISYSLLAGKNKSTFDLNSIQQAHFDELMLVMKLTKSKIDLKNFKEMYSMGLLLAKQLDGVLANKNKVSMTENHFMDYWKKINQNIYDNA